MSTHFIVRCTGCKAIISQCRCPGPKEEREGRCLTCETPDEIAALRAEVERLREGQKALMAQTVRIRRAICENDAQFHFAEDTETYAKQLKARAEKAEREINDAWLMIENGWDDNIESRAEWEKRYRKNFNDGGSGPLGMAIHAAGYKRETKAEARAEKLAAALREIQEGKGPFDRDNHKFACNVIESMKAIAALALADGEEK